jgi:hypothetical protein
MAPYKSLVRFDSHHELHMFRRNDGAPKQPEPSRSGNHHPAVKISEITKMEDFLTFLGEDDRLCVVK